MTKPKVLFVIDVVGGAGDIKSNFIKHHLSKYYDIDIVHMSYNPPKIDKKKYDLYFTYGFAFVHFVSNTKKYITGVTAHRKKSQIVKEMKKTEFHHANSVLLYNELKNGGIKNIFYTPNGVDTELFKPLGPMFKNRSYPVFGHVGKKSPNKNQATFLEPILKELNCFYQPHYNDFRDKIPHNKMVFKYQDFDIFVASSTEDGTPNGMLEAAACGRPAIINKIGNAPELIKNGYNGFCLNMDKKEYLHHINWCMMNPHKILEMGRNARKEILNGDGKIMSKNYLLMFDKILGINRGTEIYENPALYHIEGYKEKGIN